MSRLNWLAIIAVSLLLLPSCATRTTAEAFQPTEVEARLTSLMARRLEIARQVAWVKFGSNLPVRDPKREEELLASLEEKGRTRGLAPTLVRSFFRAQIEASCQVQQRLIGKWSRGGTLPAWFPRDLRRDIRPELDRIGDEMLACLVPLSRTPARAGFHTSVEAALRRDGFSWREARTAVGGLL